MKRLIGACAVLLWAGAAFAASSEFHDGRLARIDDPLRVEFPGGVDLPTLRQAITSAAAGRDWEVSKESLGQLDLTRRIADKHTIRIALDYHPRGYTIRYLDSANMLYNAGAVNMRGFHHRAIHRNYNTWIRQLAESVNAAVGVSAVVWSGSRVAAPGQLGLPAPLPENVTIVPPGPDAAPQAAAYSGQWAGTWGTTLQHILVVERIEGRNVTLLYCWGTNQQIRDPGCTHEIATVDDDGVLRGKWGNGAQVSYRIAADRRSVQGEYERNGQLTFGKFDKVGGPLVDGR